MFDTIIWATDGCELADGSLPFVQELARVHDSHVVAVHVDEVLVGRFGGVPVLADEGDLLPKLRAQVEQLRSDGIDAELRVVRASGRGPSQVIADVARELDADVVVVATHAYGLAGTLLAGSVTKSLVHDSPCAVLSVPPAVTSKVEALA